MPASDPEPIKVCCADENSDPQASSEPASADPSMSSPGDLDGSAPSSDPTQPISTEQTSPQDTSTQGSTAITDITITRDITYTTATTSSGTTDLRLDLYVPVDANGRELIAGQPAIVLIHGGGFLLGSKTAPNMVTWATALAEAGYVVANINYRLVLDTPTVTTPELIDYFSTAELTAALPAQAPEQALEALRVSVAAAVEDAAAATTWLADQGVDATRIALAGESAGSITALHLAYLNDTAQLTSVAPAAVVNLYGALSTPTSGSIVNPGDPPAWTLHGTSDQLVPFPAAEYLADALEAAGIMHTDHHLDGKGHGFDAVEFFTGGPTPETTYLHDSLDFLATHLQ